MNQSDILCNHFGSFFFFGFSPLSNINCQNTFCCTHERFSDVVSTCKVEKSVRCSSKSRIEKICGCSDRRPSDTIRHNQEFHIWITPFVFMGSQHLHSFGAFVAQEKRTDLPSTYHRCEREWAEVKDIIWGGLC